MNKELKQQLEKAFPAKVIKKRRGPGGKELSYAPVAFYIARLNECFGNGWGFEITAREHHADQVIVEGRLIADGVVKAGIGGAEGCRRKEAKLRGYAKLTAHAGKTENRWHPMNRLCARSLS